MLDHIAKRLKDKAKWVREYEVIETEDGDMGMEGAVMSRHICASEYERAMRQKEQLLREYQDKSLEEVIPGETISNDRGACYYIQHKHDVSIQKADLEKSRQVICSNLKLIYGIGEVRERELKQQGYNTIYDLMRHPRWRDEAGKFLEAFESRDTRTLQDLLWRWLPRSDPLLLYLAGIHDKNDFIIFDIETMGLFGRPIILLGIARQKKERINTHQYLLRDIPDEPGALWEFISHLEGNTALITFNGRSFDIPYVEERLGFYGLNASIERPHFDVLHFARRAFRGRVPDCRLVTLERYLFGIERKDDVPSTLVPEFYETYLKTRNPGLLIPIIEHNRQDLITLSRLFSRLYDILEDA
ncbi:MAG TPA: exonuclease [Candidatus Altiarchaeales archaeon]|nr:exonuclease [Candidatus Altiarchaeales archaeon]